jgi:hypothetical protein
MELNNVGALALQLQEVHQKLLAYMSWTITMIGALAKVCLVLVL